ncbi:MAG TPA: hypothetical protein VI997_11340 [Candidatus Thermoplasmatota archaeon]|nr:hypothetical protein [Candidatus Thermoplasmatota archaeon]
MRPAILTALALLSAGCVAPAEETSPDTSAASSTAATPPAPETESYDVGFLVAVATPARSSGAAIVEDLLEKEGGLSGYVIEAEWTPATPAAEKLSLWIRIAGAGAIPPGEPAWLATPPEPIAKSSGGSPLRAVVPADLLEDGAEYEVLVRAAAEPAGAAADQAVTVHITKFLDVALDEAFSATSNDEAK